MTKTSTASKTLTKQPKVAPPPEPEERPVGECAALIGLDWGDRQHAVALWAPGGPRMETFILAHSAETLHGWLEELHKRFGGQPVAVAVEASKGAVVAALLEHPWVLVYPVHPATSRRFSTAFTPSRAKDDVPDACTLLEILRGHRDRLRLLAPHDPDTERLGLLNEARRTLVDRRTLLSNQLTSLLKNYYPQALGLTADKRYAPMTLAFLERWPELAILQQARAQTLRCFYHKHGVRRLEVIEQRLELVRTARPLSANRALCDVSIMELGLLVAELRVLAEHLGRFEEAIAEAFAGHPEAAFFAGLPGAGAAMAPRLAVLFGTDRQRWQSAAELQTYYGIAPVLEGSGSKRWVHWRWKAPTFARQTLVEWAGLSVTSSAWAAAYYRLQKSRGKAHAAILRSLAFKWLRILWRCWMQHTHYDEARYLVALQSRSPALFALISQPTKLLN